MSFLSKMEAKMPPGFRFHPRDEELICDYLEKKIKGDNNSTESVHCCSMMIEVNLNNCEPWDLPETACVGRKEWYFFSVRGRKYGMGQRTNRATISGYWKATGKDRPVMREGVLVGMRKTLVFYLERAPNGKKTEWIMHEFRIELPAAHRSKFSTKEDWLLCKVFFKSRSTINIPKTMLAASTAAADFFLDGSSPLPSLSYTYDHHHSQMSMELDDCDQHAVVPACFSNPLVEPTVVAPANHLPPPQPDDQLTTDTRPWLMSQLVSDDVNMIRSVFSHLTKLEGMESYFS